MANCLLLKKILVISWPNYTNYKCFSQFSEIPHQLTYFGRFQVSISVDS